MNEEMNETAVAENQSFGEASMFNCYGHIDKCLITKCYKHFLVVSYRRRNTDTHFTDEMCLDDIYGVLDSLDTNKLVGKYCSLSFSISSFKAFNKDKNDYVTFFHPCSIRLLDSIDE